MKRMLDGEKIKEIYRDYMEIKPAPRELGFDLGCYLPLPKEKKKEREKKKRTW